MDRIFHDDDIRLVVIPPPPMLTEPGIVERCRSAERGGATSVQVRAKGMDASTVVALTTQLVRGLAIPVYVNDRIDIAMAAGAAGVHLGADDFPADRIRAVAPRPMRVGVSVGDDLEAERARHADADYWSIGPYGATESKGDAGVPLGSSGLARLATRAPGGVPVIAIGGIEATTVAGAIGAGAVGVAVISAVFGSSDIEAATRRLRDAIDRVR